MASSGDYKYGSKSYGGETGDYKPFQYPGKREGQPSPTPHYSKVEYTPFVYNPTGGAQQGRVSPARGPSRPAPTVPHSPSSCPAPSPGAVTPPAKAPRRPSPRRPSPRRPAPQVPPALDAAGGVSREVDCVAGEGAARATQTMEVAGRPVQPSRAPPEMGRPPAANYGAPEPHPAPSPGPAAPPPHSAQPAPACDPASRMGGGATSGDSPAGYSAHTAPSGYPSAGPPHATHAPLHGEPSPQHPAALSSQSFPQHGPHSFSGAPPAASYEASAHSQFSPAGPHHHSYAGPPSGHLAFAAPSHYHSYTSIPPAQSSFSGAPPGASPHQTTPHPPPPHPPPPHHSYGAYGQPSFGNGTYDSGSSVGGYPAPHHSGGGYPGAPSYGQPYGQPQQVEKKKSLWSYGGAAPTSPLPHHQHHPPSFGAPYPAHATYASAPSMSGPAGPVQPVGAPFLGSAPNIGQPSGPPSAGEADKFSKKKNNKEFREMREEYIELSSAILEKLRECEEIPEDAGFETHYRYVINDPRYVRLKRKLCPELFSRDFLKSMVDPANIPYIGIGIKAYRLQKMKSKKKTMKTISQQEGVLEDEQSVESLKHIQTGMEIETIKRGADFGAEVILSVGSLLLPGVDILAIQAADLIIPAIGPDVAAELAERGSAAKMGKNLGEHEDAALQRNMHATFNATKAFFMYLGYPETDDVLYRRWESSRLVLKSVYGALREDDLYKIKPSKEIEKRLAAQKKATGTFDLKELGVSLLWILWRVYECWDLFYYEYGVMKLKTGLKDDEAKQQYLLRERQKERMMDIAYLEKTYSGNDDRVLRVHKTREAEILSMLMNVYLGHPRFAFLEVEDEEDSLYRNTHHYLRCMTTFFLEKQEAWAFQDIDARIHACALVEPVHHRNVHLDALTSHMLKNKKLGKGMIKKIEEQREMERKFRKEQGGKKGKNVRCIYYVGYRDTELGRKGLKILMDAILTADAYDTYAIEYVGVSEELSNLWEHCGFVEENVFQEKIRALWYRQRFE